MTDGNASERTLANFYVFFYDRQPTKAKSMAHDEDFLPGIAIWQINN